MSHLTEKPGGEGVLLGIFIGGVPPVSPNPDPISDQRMPFPISTYHFISTVTLKTSFTWSTVYAVTNNT